MAGPRPKRPAFVPIPNTLAWANTLKPGDIGTAVEEPFDCDRIVLYKVRT